MISKTPHYNAKIKTILDALEPGERVCVLTGEKWFMDGEEIGWYRKFQVPPSKYAPRTRLKLINSYFVIFDIWYNRHAETGKTIISNIHPATGIRVLPDKEWFEKDFTSHAKTFDSSHSFFDQFYELSRSVPRAAGYNYVQPENSIAFISFGDQDSYFVLACQSKRCFFSINATRAEDCAELSMVNGAQNSYNVIHSDRIYHCRFVRESYDCLHSDFLFDCRNCEYCFGATNKRHRKYLWFNEQLSKEEWEKRFAEVDLTSYENLQKYRQKFYDLVNKAVWPENFNVNTENCLGEYLSNVSNIQNGYYAMAAGSRDIAFSSYIIGPPSHDIYFVAAPIGSSDSYYGLGMEGCSHVRFSLSINAKNDSCEYCESCYDCRDCFGCVGLRKKRFCILNKQLDEETYWKEVDKIKCAMMESREYGDIPPAKFSTQFFMGSGAAVLYGATEEDRQKLGAAIFKPSDEGGEGPHIDPAEIYSTEDIPDFIPPSECENVLGKPYFDKKMGRRYAYLKAELAFYTRLKIAPPRVHPTRRILDLYQEMNMAVFEQKNCTKCQREIMVAKNRHYPNRLLYCSPCYLRFIEENG